MPYRARIGVLGEVPPRDDGVDGGDQFSVRRQLEQGGIVADTENDAGLSCAIGIAAAREEAAYQFELAEIGRPCAHRVLLGRPAVLVRP